MTDFTPFIQYRVTVGSRAFGLATEHSDTDLRGFYLPPAREHWRLQGIPEQLEWGEECYWEAQKFVSLALKANPNILEVLHSPLVHTCTPVAQALLDIRHAFLSRKAAQTYCGYVASQLGRAGSTNIRWKPVMHLLRLLLSGTHLLQTGELVLDVGEQRERLLAIKRGEWTWEEVQRWHAQLQAQFEQAAQHSPLPEQPDVRAVEDWLIRARREAVEW